MEKPQEGEEKIEKLMSLAGNNHKYQYFVLIIFLLVWLNCNFMPISLPYLERSPLIKYTDDDGIVHKNTPLINEICQEYKNSFKITKQFKYSWISEFNIECSQIEIGKIGAYTFLGSAMGGLVFTLISKHFTYRQIIIFSAIGLNIVLFTFTLINSYLYFMLLLIFTSLAGCFGELMCYSTLVLAEEIICSEKRSLFSSVINIGYALGGIILSLVYLYVQKWRYVFYILLAVNTINIIIISSFIYDSPRRYINNKDFKNSLRILKGIARINGREDEFKKKILTEEYRSIIEDITLINSNAVSSKELINFEKKEREIQLISDKNEEENKSFDLFKYPTIKNKFIFLCIIWIGTRGTFNGIGISSKLIRGNFYTNNIFLYIIEAISYYVSGSIIDYKCLGRKGALWFYYFIMILSFLIMAFATLKTPLELFMNLIARFCACGVEVILYTYTLEVYPTLVRSTAFGINIFFGNLGAIISPMLLELLPKIIFYIILIGYCVINSFLLIFIPETVGKPMTEMIEELN